MEVKSYDKKSEIKMSKSYRRKLTDANTFLLESGNLSDVTFVVGKDKTCIKAHKLFLMARSEVFEVMFQQKWDTKYEKTGQVEIPNVKPNSFHAFLKFLYTDKFLVKVTDTMEVLHLSHLYDVQSLADLCAEQVKSQISVNNAICIYEAAIEYKQSSLMLYALDFMLTNAESLVQQEEFMLAKLDTLIALVNNDKLLIKEINMFKAVFRWSRKECVNRRFPVEPLNCRKILKDVIPEIRFPLMTPEEFAADVASTKVLTDQEVINLFRHFNVASDRRHTLPRTQFSTRIRTPQQSPGWLGSKFAASCHNAAAVCQAHENTIACLSTDPPLFTYEETLSFQVNRDVFITGFGFYGPDKENQYQGSKTFAIELSIKNPVFLCIKGLDAEGTATAKSSCTTTENFDLGLDSPFKVRGNQSYSLRVIMHGERTQVGSSIKQHSEVVCEGVTVVFKFTSSSAQFGIIRSVLFSL